ncbi:hypothetical protein [Pseudomonas sp. SID14000]|uniref:hypothetical protein n=1 Tax=Pseudomonas sp. SID14000 TaxID=1986221 RepID=UPI000B3CE019|nr:hypothetical protein [Pseudomonas sp. SID14000]
MTHVLLKAGTAIPSKDKLHPELRPHMPAIERLAKLSEDQHGLTWDKLLSGPPVHHSDLEELNRSVFEHGRSDRAGRYSSGVYSIPFLHPEYVDDLLTEIAAMSFEVNADEEAEVQIPEVTLQDRCPSLHAALASLFMHVVGPLAKILYQLDPKFIQSIQFAQYRPQEVAKGHWHHDQDSDITLVVALSDDHKGGGTMVKPQGFGEPFEVPQLPLGHAMLFQGSRTLHYGMPVTEGARNLLVFWSTLRK